MLGTKKRGRKRFRKAKVVDEEEEEAPEVDGGVDGLGSHEVAELLREEQRARVRRAGVGSGDLSKVERKRARAAAKGDDTALGVVEDAKTKAEKVDKLIKGTFAASTTTNVQQAITEKQMEDFIEQRMGKPEAGDDDELLGPDELTELGEPDRVLNMPLRPTVEPLVPVSAVEDGSEDGAMPFNTGIAEVALPMSYRIKNMEETDRLRKKAETRKPWEGSSTVAGSFSANYNRHRRDHMEALAMVAPQGGVATDKRAVDKYHRSVVRRNK